MIPVADPAPVVADGPSPAEVSNQPASLNGRTSPPFAPLANFGLIAVPAPAGLVLTVRSVAVPPATAARASTLILRLVTAATIALSVWDADTLANARLTVYAVEPR